MDRNNKSLWVPDITCRFCGCKTAWFAPEWQVYMGSSLHLFVFFSCKTATLWTRLSKTVWGPDLIYLQFCAWKPMQLWLVPEIACLYGSWNSLCDFLHAKHRAFCIRITSLYGSQSSSVVSVHSKQRLIGTSEITNLYESQTSLVVLCRQYSVISSRITCLYGSQPLSVIFACKTATFGV